MFAIGDTISQYIQANQLEPVTSEWTEVLGDSHQAKVWTKQGLIVASNDGGDWVAAGPFGLAG